MEVNKESLSSPDDPLSFMHGLLQNLNDEGKLALLLMEEKVGDEIVFLQDHDVRYFILGADDKLDQ